MYKSFKLKKIVCGTQTTSLYIHEVTNQTHQHQRIEDKTQI